MKCIQQVLAVDDASVEVLVFDTGLVVTHEVGSVTFTHLRVGRAKVTTVIERLAQYDQLAQREVD